MALQPNQTTGIKAEDLAEARQKFYATVPENQRPSADGAYRDPFYQDKDGTFFQNEWTAGTYNRQPGAKNAEDFSAWKDVPTFYNNQAMGNYDKITADLKGLQGSAFSNIQNLFTQAMDRMKR